MKRTYLISFLVMMSFLPFFAYSITLGDINVYSFLNQPLKAKITLLNFKGTSTTDIKAALAPNSVYKELGLKTTRPLPPLNFVISKENQNYFVVITSPQVISDPIIEFVIEVDDKGQQVYRNYVILLDPAPPVNPASAKLSNTVKSSTPNNIQPISVNDTIKTNQQQTSPLPTALKNLTTSQQNVTAQIKQLPNKTDLTKSSSSPLTSDPSGANNQTNSRANDNVLPLTNDVNLLKEKLITANNFLVALQQKNEMLSFKIQDMQLQITGLQNQLNIREKKLVSLETQIAQMKNNQINTMLPLQTKSDEPSPSFNWFWLIGLISGLAIVAVFYKYLLQDFFSIKKSNQEIEENENCTTSVVENQETGNPSETKTELTKDIDILEARSTEEQIPINPNSVQQDSSIQSHEFDEQTNHEQHDNLQLSDEVFHDDNVLEFQLDADELKTISSKLSDIEAQSQAFSAQMANDEDNSLKNDSAKIDEKIDLAYAYLEFHDIPSAKELLQDVIATGNPQQKQKAEQLLNKIAEQQT